MLKRTTIVAFVLSLILAGAWHLSRARGYQLFGEIVTSVPVSDSLIALTLDDGPTVRYTDEVLDLLSAHQIHATFFLTGREVEANMLQARRIRENGHEIGNHSYNHETMMLRSQRYVGDEIERTDAAIRETGYKGPIHFRPPFGKKLVALPWYLSRHDRKTIMWDIEPESYPEIARDPDRLTAHVLERARPGSIILMHVMYESRAVSRAALPSIIEGLMAKGYRFVTVSELLEAQSG